MPERVSPASRACVPPLTIAHQRSVPVPARWRWWSPRALSCALNAGSVAYCQYVDLVVALVLVCISVSCGDVCVLGNNNLKLGQS
jgi:hypothetical protein